MKITIDIKDQKVVIDSDQELSVEKTPEKKKETVEELKERRKERSKNWIEYVKEHGTSNGTYLDMSFYQFGGVKLCKTHHIHKIRAIKVQDNEAIFVLLQDDGLEFEVHIDEIYSTDLLRTMYYLNFKYPNNGIHDYLNG